MMRFLAEVRKAIASLVTSVNGQRAILLRISFGQHDPECIFLSLYLYNEKMDPFLFPNFISLSSIHWKAVRIELKDVFKQKLFK